MSATARVAGVPVSLDHYIGGERVASADGARFADLSPIDEELLGEVARGGAAEARDAVSAADAAFGGWAAAGPERRARHLHQVADVLERRIGELAAVETADNGALLRSHLRGVMPRVVHNFRFFADWLLRLGHEDFDTRGHRNHVSWDPAGVAVLITPWNAPLMLATWKVAPALAAGATVVLKPAEWAPLTASLLADAGEEAGLPPGVLNVVQGIGAEAGQALVADERVARISFTGSVPTARVIAAAAAPALTPVSFELGGKSPLLVFAAEDEAVALANGTDYGLAAVVVTGDRDRAGRVSARLVAGTVWVNCFFVRDLRAPFGGARNSGIGREGGDWSFDFYCDVKNTVTAPAGWTQR